MDVGACSLTSATLSPRPSRPFRGEVVRQLSSSKTLGAALARLRDAMRADVWIFGDARLTLALAVREYDRRLATMGFMPCTIGTAWPRTSTRTRSPWTSSTTSRPSAAAIRFDAGRPGHAHRLLLHARPVAAHAASVGRGDADANLDRVEALLQLLQGPGRQRPAFAADAETLLLIATAHYEREEWGYAGLLARGRARSTGSTAPPWRPATALPWAVTCASGSKPPTAGTRR